MPPLAASWETIDPFIEAFEKSLADHGRADLARFLPASDHPHYHSVLRELVRVDLEFGWESKRPRRVEDYLTAFPVLRDDPESLQELAFEEYRLRQRAGEHPSPDEYRSRLGIDCSSWPVLPPTTPEPSTSPNSVASAEALAELSRADPEAADRLAEAMTSLPSPGQTFLGFHLVGELGRGAFGRVYLARQGDLADRLVALKIGGDLAGESRFLARLQHTNVVPVHSVHRAKPFQALCMPYFGSTTLAHVLTELRSLPAVPKSGAWLNQVSPRGSHVETVLWLVARLADGLAYAHDRGVLHQDIKPANVLLSDDGQPMLLDFSLSRDTRLGSSLPAAYVGGTLPYMAPDQLAAFRDSQRHADARSDVYALGLILFELLTAKPAFPIPPGSLTEKLRRMIADRNAGAPDVRRLNHAVSPAVASIVRRCLEPDPKRRYQSARHLQEDVERHLAHRPLRWAREPSLVERGRKWARRHPRLASGYAVGTVALAVVLGLAGLVAVRGWSLARHEAAQTRRDFEAELRQVRFLLGGPTPSRADLTEGVAVARRALGRYRVLEESAWNADQAVTLLPDEQRRALPAEVRELLVLLSRGERLRAPPEDPMKEPIRLNELAAACPAGDDGLRAVLMQRRLLPGAEASVADIQFEQARALPSRTARDHYLNAVYLMDQGDFRAARDHLMRARDLSPQDAYVWYQLGRCHAEMREYPHAAEALTASIALWPDFFASHYQRARVHNELGEYHEAIKEFIETLRLEPDYLDALIDRSFPKTALRDYEGAEADLSQALDAGIMTVRVYSYRANVRRLAGDEKGALSDLALGLKCEPEDDLDWVALGLAHRDNGDVKAALGAFQKALGKNPRCTAALEDRAAVLADQPGRVEDAIKDLDQVIAIAPAYGQARAGRGVLLARLGRRDAALEDAREAERVDPRPSVLYQAAGIYALTSRKEPADRKDAYRLIAAAFRGGYGYDLLSDDPDLKSLHDQKEFRELADAARALQSH